MRVLTRLLMLCAGSLLAAAVAAQQVVPVPRLNARITDLTGTLDPRQVQTLEAELAALEQKKGSQLVVLMLSSTGDEPIETFALKVAEQNRIGREKVDDGVLLLIAKDDRRARIEVGYGLEGAITDVQSARIIREYLAPAFRQNDYAGGITQTTQILAKLIDGEPLPEPAVRAERERDPPWVFAIVLGLFIGLFVSGWSFLPGLLRRGLAAIGAGFLGWNIFSLGIAAAAAGIVAFLVAGASRSGRYITHGNWPSGGGGWSGGGGGGGWSGGGGGGGWSGGGGGFGGGGASGDW